MYHDRSQRQKYSHLGYDVGMAREYEKRTRMMFEMVRIGASLKCNSEWEFIGDEVLTITCNDADVVPTTAQQ